MITLDIANLHRISPTHGLSKRELLDIKQQLKPDLKKIHARKQGFYRIIDDSDTVKQILAYAKKMNGKFSDIIILGIGGSALGTLCLQQSLTHLYENELDNRKYPRLRVLDNIDPTLLLETQEVLTLKQTLFIVTTKSGNTPETLAQYFYFRKLVRQHHLDAKKHFVFITDPKRGLLREMATVENIPIFTVPENVGGRFSVQTAVGLLPAALIGVDIKRLLAGCRSMRDQFLSLNPTINLPFRLASIQYLLAKKAKNIQVLMPYAQHLIRLADWYRQLLAESIGKAKNNKGEMVHIGLTPVNALGVTDQHSQSQLYNEGPNDKFIMFIAVDRLAKTLAIPGLYPSKDEVVFLQRATFNELIKVEHQATAEAYTKNDRPNITIHIPRVDAYTLGELFLLFEGATAFLGEFYDINAFDQPGVELSKQLTKKYLLKP